MTDMEPLVPVPGRGRVFRRERRVRLGDASPGGRLRLDALARYLQDVSNDDTRDAGLDDEMGWVVRRTVVEVRQFPVFGEVLELATFCGGTGSRWAERRVSVAGDQGGAVEAATLWVHLDAAGRPRVLPQQFHELFGEAAGGRVVRARLHHGDVEPGGSVRAWPLRFCDFDVLGHVNNAASWEAVEELLADRRHLRAPLRAELEFRTAVELGAALRLVAHDRPGALAAWLVDGEVVATSALVRSLT